MVSQTTLTIIFGYASAFWCLDALSAEASKTQTPRSGGAFVSRLATGALLPAVVAIFALSSLLLFAHVRSLGSANAAAARRRRFLDRLANATLAATAAALLAGAVLRLGAHGYLGGGDIGWLWLSKE